MNQQLLQILLSWPKCYITGPDLRTRLQGSDDAKKAIVKRAVHEAFLERLKNDLYLIKNCGHKHRPNAFELAQFIHGPSYISFESALSHYRWIPEAVMVICSATIKQTRTYDVSLATFSYEKTPIQSFHLGVTQHQSDDAYYMMADPWKALADMMYTRKRYWQDINALQHDLRIEADSLLQSDLTVLQTLALQYAHLATRRCLKQLLHNVLNVKGNS